jgi:hypothetical protein
MKPMVFVRTRYIGEGGKIRANLANTTLKRGSSDSRYSHSLSVSDNHLVAARLWIIEHMQLIQNKPVGVQSYDNGYIYAFAAD